MAERHAVVRSRNPVALVAVGACTLFTLVLAVRPLSDEALVVVSDVGLLLGGTAAGTYCLRARRRLSGPTRRAWLLIGLGLLTWAAGQLYWTVAQDLFGVETPFPSPADGAYLVAYALTAVGIATFPSAIHLSRIRAALDGAIVATSLLFISWQLLLADALAQRPSLLVATAYPVADIVLGVSLVAALTRSRGRRVDLRLLCAAAAVHIVANTSYLYLLAEDSYRSGSLIDSTWMVWFALTVVAATRAENHVDARRPAVVNAWYALLPYTAVAGALAVRVWMTITGRTTHGAAAILAVLLVVLIVVRHLITLLENESLNRSLMTQVTKLEEAHTETRNATDLLGAVLRGLPGGAYRYAYPDPGRRLFASEGLAELTGYTAEELIGDGAIADLVDPHDVPLMTAAIDDALSEGTGLLKVRHRIVTKDGSLRWVDNRAQVSREPDGPVVVNGFLTDVTAERQAAMQAEHTRRVEAVGRLAAGVAHDVNNILTALQCHSGMLRHSLDRGTPSLADLDGVDDAARRVSGLARQLLSLSRNGPAQQELIDVGDVVTSMQPLLRNVIAPEVALVAEVDPDLPAVLGDRSRLEQVALNLALNAGDACRTRGGRIDLRVRVVEVGELQAVMRGLSAGPHVVLEVVDDGAGMDVETQERCYDPFFSTKGSGGSGLGLATVSAVVRECGGAVEVDSEVGLGTCFSVYFPAVAEVAEVAAAVAEVTDSDGDGSGGGARVLVVDDEEPVLAAARAALAKAGYSVEVAPSAAVAVRRVEAAAAAEPYELVLTDIRMPGMSGVELAAVLRAEHPDVKVLFMSGDDRRELRVEGAPVLAKPFAVNDLVAAVEGAL